MVGQGGVVVCVVILNVNRSTSVHACSIAVRPTGSVLGPWGVGGSAGPATEGLKRLSGRVQNPTQGFNGGRVGRSEQKGLIGLSCYSSTTGTRS